MTDLLWWVFASLAIGGGLGMILGRSPVASLLSLILTFFSLAAIYVLLGAHFIAAIQIIVYAGAIMVLFLFVVMLLNVRERETAPWYLRKARFMGGVFALLFFFIIGYGIYAFAAPVSAVPSPLPSITGIATLLTTKYSLPFILTSLLLLVAVIGAVVMGRRQDPETGEEYTVDDSELV